MNTTTSTNTSDALNVLTPELVEQFFREGYLIVDNVFNPEDLDPLIEEVDSQVRGAAKELHENGELNFAYADENFHTQLARVYEESKDAGKEIIGRIEGKGGGGQHGEEMFKMITHKKLMAYIEDLVGPEIVGSSVFRLRPKLPNSKRGIVPWHQDSGYLRASCDREMIITCWIPLVDASEHNGCMQIMPKCHKDGILQHHTGGNAHFLVIYDDDLPEKYRDQIVTAAVPKGGAVFMTNMTPHCSTPNNSEGVRWSIDLRYQAKGVPNNTGLWPDIDKEQDIKINMACYPPEADFIVHSKEDPSQECTYEDFKQRRITFENSTSLREARHLRADWTPADISKVI